MSKIAVMTGSVRPGRNSLKVAEWVKSDADKRGAAEYEIVDIADYDLLVWDEALPAMMGQYEKESTKDWRRKSTSSTVSSRTAR